MSPFAKDLPFNNIQNVKQYLLYHYFTSQQCYRILDGKYVGMA